MSGYYYLKQGISISNRNSKRNKDLIFMQMYCGFFFKGREWITTELAFNQTADFISKFQEHKRFRNSNPGLNPNFAILLLGAE